ncbi:MAG: colanic acid biosynthesis glycosyl transferase WcaI [Thermoleophilaceae bacterium]|nr:colanic acid biosynthesis glycosyl transferase WcaI [Thermoleophilaceae bacterium]
MKILIIGINYAPEQAGIAVYTSGFAEDLVKRGHEVVVVCAPPHFPAWRVQKGYSARAYRSSIENGVRVVRCPTYVPRTTSAVKRILHYLSFAGASFPVALHQAFSKRPDIVFCVAPALLSAGPALIAARLAGARTWLHVQDLEIDAAFATGVMRPGAAGRLALATERFLLRRFDRVSTISPQMAERIRAKGVPAERLTQFRNWSDLSAITPLDRPSRFRDWWRIREEHVALYSGSIGNKQGIETVIDAARQLRHRSDLMFVICGEGPNRDQLERLAADLPNVRFFDLQPREKLNELLGLASVHLLPQLADAADSVLPSKLTNMLASGRPVVATAAAGTGLFDEVRTCGLSPTPGDADALARAIAELLDDADARVRLGTAARLRAEETIAADRILAGVATGMCRLAGEAA